MLTPEEVARGINQARVHLALSAAEACMLCFTEGLLCGVPAISTACESARTEFFDARFVSVVRDEPRAVSDSIRDMVTREVHTSVVRAFALGRLRSIRVRYATYVAKIAGTRVEEVHSYLVDASGGAQRLID